MHEYLRPYYKLLSIINIHQGASLYLFCIVLLTSYLLIFQSGFVLSGDTWAEAFPEYVNDVLTKDASDILQSSWAGYLTIIPSFFTQLYVSLPLPLGSIDYYFRFLAVAFAVLSCSFIAHTINRRYVKSDILRLILAFLVLLSICHVSSMAFINIWYVGAIVIILVSALDMRLKPQWEVLFTIFAILLCLTKPLLVVLPFILYRIIRQIDYTDALKLIKQSFTKTKKASSLLTWKSLATTTWINSWPSLVSSALIVTAIAIETFYTVFGANGFSGGASRSSIFLFMPDFLLASGTLLLKALHIPLLGIISVIISSIVVVILFILAFRKAKLLSLTMALCLIFGLYLHIYSPDNNFANVWVNFNDLYSDQTKLQRELAPTFIILLVLFMNLGMLVQSRAFINYKRYYLVPVIGIIILFVGFAKPWDTIFSQKNSELYYVNIDNFRDSLNSEQPVCMPVAPTIFLDSSASWFFQYKGGCYQLNDHSSEMTISTYSSIIDKQGIDIQLDGGLANDLKAVTLPIKTTGSMKGISLELQDKLTGKTFISQVNQLPSSLQQVSFNTNTLERRSGNYDLTVRLHIVGSQPSSISLGLFSNSKPAVYALYIGIPQ